MQTRVFIFSLLVCWSGLPAAAARAQSMQRRIDALERQVAHLAARVERLERGSPDDGVGEPPTEFGKPHVAWQAFGTWDASGIPSGSVYLRPAWEQVHTGPRQADWSQIDAAVAAARQQGKKVALRIMPCSPGWMGGPAWMQAAGLACHRFRHPEHQGLMTLPDLDSKPVREEIEWFLRALGERYGADDLEYVDVMGVGLWGEWHHYGCSPAVPMPSYETLTWLIDLHEEIFPDVPKIMLLKRNIEGREGDACKYALSKGFGWRVDSVGDPASHRRYYEQAIRETGAADTWRHAPVALEPSGTMDGWSREQFELMADFARKYGASYLHNKGRPVPPALRGELEKLLDAMNGRRTDW